jgi:hypothetical protein
MGKSVNSLSTVKTLRLGHGGYATSDTLDSKHPNKVTAVREILLLTDDIGNYWKSLFGVLGGQSLRVAAGDNFVFWLESPKGGIVTVRLDVAKTEEEVEWVKKHGEGFRGLVMETQGEEKELSEVGVTLKKRL